MSDSSPNSSSVLLTIDEKVSSTRGAQYASIAPKASATTASQAALGLSPIAPAAESRADGTPMLGGSPSASSDRGGSSGGGNGEGPSTAAGKRKNPEEAAEAGRRKTAAEGAPEAGSEEWLRLRRLAHKEVEQRRRDVINSGIDRLAELVPGAERHRGRIVNQAVDYIHRLKETEAQNIEKWTIEKLLADQVISGLTNQLEQMKRENKRLKRKIKAIADGAQLADSPVDDDDDDTMDQEDEQDESNVVSGGLPIVDASMASEAAAAAAGIIETNADHGELDGSKSKSKPGKRRKK
ncbi:basic helix-loop-helix protein [Coemansia spiralis]|uniref:Basic helix-loop-helix protein n=1 Tax=Coemansia spiralis TaxID=417178 RepID=A0A9W8L0M4_9FUNG|nr:basic helix-loop-helix protein [Coemansia spiralis]